MLARPELWMPALYAILPVAVACAVFFDMTAAVGLVLFAEIAVPEIRFSATSLSAGELCLLAATGTLALRALARSLRGAGRPNTSDAADFGLLVGIFSALGVATAASIAHAEFRVPVLRETAKVCEYFLAAALGFSLTRRGAPHARIFGMLGGLGVVAALAALIEIQTGSASVFRAGDRLVPRIAGFLEGPNQLGAFLALLLPCCAVGATAYRGRRPLATCLSVAAALATVALFLTFSRAGILTGCIELFAGIACVGRFAERRGAYLAAVACVLCGICAAAAVAGPAIMHLGTIGNEGDTGAVGHRGDLWRAALTFWRGSPWLGIGAGNFELELARVGLPRVRTHANSLYLQSLAEGGVVLGAAVLLAIVLPLQRMTARVGASPLVAAIFIALCGYAAHQCVDTLNFYPKIGILAWILTGAGLGVRTDEPDIRHYARSAAPLG